MNETKLVLIVRHKTELPDLVTDVLAQRFYDWAHAKGCAVDVTASIETSKRLEQSDGQPTQ